METRDIAFCGLYCPMCSFRVGHETGDRRHILASPSDYDDMKDRPLEVYACNGCRVDDACGDCSMKDCATEKGLLTCADCEQFPCEHTDAFASDGIPHHHDAIDNLHRIRKIGYDAWVDEMKAKATGPNGERNSWYYMPE